MLVNSIAFWLFFFIVLSLYFSIFRKNYYKQNCLLLGASYVFYGYVDWRMCGLLFVITILFYFLGRIVKENRKVLLLSISVGIAILGFFKYVDFFIVQLATVANLFGFKAKPETLNIIVPIGVSFFTFKLIAYVIDIYKGKMPPVTDFVSFAVWVSFFPTIMSGPIDRAVDTIPQLQKVRKWNSMLVLEGCKRILWGMFLKMCIADKVGSYTDAVYSVYEHHAGITIITASILYSFQIYADFCGYSEMSIGVAKILGITVPENFLRPYFSTNIGDFWRRWHMSLMSWLRDYVYIPLGGSRCSNIKVLCNTIITFLISGLWHGANWTFVLWGGYHGSLVFFRRSVKQYMQPLSLFKSPFWHRIKECCCILLTFLFCTIGWMLFRSNSVEHFWNILMQIQSPGRLFFSWALTGCFSIIILLFKEWKDEKQVNLHFLHSRNLYVQAISIGALIVYILSFGELAGTQFIYFQF